MKHMRLHERMISQRRKDSKGMECLADLAALRETKDLDLGGI